MGFYNISKGDPNKLIAPQDANRRLCGIDDAVEDYKLVYWTLGVSDSSKTENQNIFSSAVCVKSCPSTDEPKLQCVNTDAVPNCGDVTTYPTSNVLNMCFPSSLDTMPAALKKKWDDVKDDLKTGDSGKVIQDLQNSWKDIAICLVMAMVYSLIYMYAMSIFPTAIAYLAIICIELVFIVGGASMIY